MFQSLYLPQLNDRTLNTYPTIHNPCSHYSDWSQSSSKKTGAEIRGLIKALEAYDFCLCPFSVSIFLRWTPGLKRDSLWCTLELKMPAC